MIDIRTVAITGASGMVGSALRKAYEAEGVRVLRMVRRPVPSGATDEVYWNPATGEIDAAALEGVDVVFNLAGKGIADGRWTARVKQEIVDSRVKGTRLIAEAIAGRSAKPKALISASAVGFYGDRGDQQLDEDSAAGTGFLAETCQQWEAANAPAWEADIRVVQARIGVVLSPTGGALKKMLPIFRMGMGGSIGSGKQYMSWIALYDLVRMLRFAADTESVHGAVNATAPNPVTNSEFTKTLGRVLGRPTVLPVPEFALKLALGEASAIVLESARVAPSRLIGSGFEFESDTLQGALERLIS